MSDFVLHAATVTWLTLCTSFSRVEYYSRCFVEFPFRRIKNEIVIIVLLADDKLRRTSKELKTEKYRVHVDTRQTKEMDQDSCICTASITFCTYYVIIAFVW